MSYKLLVIKFIVILTAFYTAQLSVNAQSLRLTGKTIIYQVSHAEKKEGNDPELTLAGKQRAGDLMRLLKKQAPATYLCNPIPAYTNDGC